MHTMFRYERKCAVMKGWFCSDELMNREPVACQSRKVRNKTLKEVICQFCCAEVPLFVVADQKRQTFLRVKNVIKKFSIKMCSDEFSLNMLWSTCVFLYSLSATVLILRHLPPVCDLFQKGWGSRVCKYMHAIAIHNAVTHGRTVQKGWSNPPGKSHPVYLSFLGVVGHQSKAHNLSYSCEEPPYLGSSCSTRTVCSCYRCKSTVGGSSQL